MKAKTQWPLPENEDSPFVKAQEDYERNNGYYRKIINSFTMRNNVLLVLVVILVGFLLWSITLPRTEPIFISVNELGETRYLGGAKEGYAGNSITPAMIQAQIIEFLEYMYSVPQDYQVMQNNLRKCYTMLTSTGATKLSTMLREKNPFDVFGLENHTVEIESVLSESENSYQVDFNVRNTQLSGSLNNITKKRALITTVILEPAEEDLLSNPAGIYIKSFDVTDVTERGVNK